MSYQNPGPYPQASAKRDTTGLGGLEARIDEIHTKIGSISENIHTLQQRLYPPRPEPVPPKGDGSIAGSIENSLNQIINRLEDLRAKSQELVTG